jgi:hypothetical protein
MMSGLAAIAEKLGAPPGAAVRLALDDVATHAPVFGEYAATPRTLRGCRERQQQCHHHHSWHLLHRE